MAMETRRGSFWLWLVVSVLLTAASAVSFTAAYYERRESDVEAIERMLREQQETSVFVIGLSADEPNIVPWLIAGTASALLALVAYVLAARRR